MRLLYLLLSASTKDLGIRFASIISLTLKGSVHPLCPLIISVQSASQGSDTDLNIQMNKCLQPGSGTDLKI